MRIAMLLLVVVATAFPGATRAVEQPEGVMQRPLDPTQFDQLVELVRHAGSCSSTSSAVSCRRARSRTPGTPDTSACDRPDGPAELAPGRFLAQGRG